MPPCPKCNEMVENPDKVLPVIVESATGEHGVTQSNVGIFRCARCDTMFPQVLTSRRYLFVPQTEFTKMGKEISTLRTEKDNLEKAVDDHILREGDLLKGKQNAQLDGLESTVKQLEAYVSYLRNEKKELEEETPY